MEEILMYAGTAAAVVGLSYTNIHVGIRYLIIIVLLFIVQIAIGKFNVIDVVYYSACAAVFILLLDAYQKISR